MGLDFFDRSPDSLDTGRRPGMPSTTSNPKPPGDVAGTVPASRSFVRRPRTGLRRKLRDLGKGQAHTIFLAGQRFGINVTPTHFYSAIPDIRALKDRRDVWRQPRSMAGVAGADVDQQLEILHAWLAGERTSGAWARACREHGEAGYGPVESDVLSAFIRSQRPRKIVQIGAGVSTAVILEAARAAGYAARITCVDPFPTEYLTKQAAAGTLDLIVEMAQDVPQSTLLDVDLLFVDSTHTVKPDSEVNRVILDILPRLSSGAWVHFHDITFPYDYSQGLLSDDLFFPNESTLLHAFLIHNYRYEIRLSLSMLHNARPTELRALLPGYSPRQHDHGLKTGQGDFPSAAYLQVIA